MFGYPITYILIAITALVSIPAFNRPDITSKLIFNASSTYHRKEYYRLFSSGLIHGDWSHLIVNMFVLYIFGLSAETNYMQHIPGGQFSFLAMYVLSLGASSVYSMYKHKDNPYYNALGASGATSAVVFSTIIFRPLDKFYLLFIPIGIPAFIFGVLYLIYSSYASKNNRDNIGHDAHFWGAIFGFVFTLILNPSLALVFNEQVMSYVESYLP